MLDAVTIARELIRIVSSDTRLPKYVRQEAASLQPIATSQPSLVFDSLEELRRQVILDLALEPPTRDYARCVPVESFWRHNLAPERRSVFATSNDYLHWIQLQSDPGAAALQDISSGNVVPAPHSWLVPADRIGGLNGRGLKTRLKLSGSGPPYLVFIFPMAKLKGAGVEVREPRGIDTVPARQVQWSPGDVPDERIDQDIPHAALGRIEWRP